MTTIAAGASATITVASGGQVAISSNGGLWTTLETPTIGPARASNHGPTAHTRIYGPYVGGATLVITNQSVNTFNYVDYEVGATTLGTIAVGASTTFTLTPQGTLSVSNPSGYWQVSVTPAIGNVSTSVFGPGTGNMVFGPYQAGATVVVTNQTGAALVTSMVTAQYAFITGTIGGTNVLTANVSASVTATSWQWTRNGSNIGGAATSTYTQVPATDSGTTIGVSINGGAFTASVSIPAIPPVFSAAPTITAATTTGVTFTAATLSNNGTPTSTVTHDLYDNGALVASNYVSGGTFVVGHTMTLIPYAVQGGVRVLTGTTSAGFVVTSGVGSDTTAAFIGDSYTFGVASSDNAHRWSSLTAAALGLTELNAGSSGTLLQNSTYQTSAPGVAQAGNGYDRFLAAIQGANARQQYFIAYGFNDIRYAGGLGADGSGTSVSMAALGTQYRQMLNALICNGASPAKITLVSTYWMPDAGLASGTAGFNMVTNLGSTAAARAQLIAGRDLVATIASEYGTLYADAYTAVQTVGAGAMSADNIHPVDSGHAAIANAVIARASNNAKPAPTNVAITRNGAGAMNVTFTAPTPPGGRTITGYTTEYGLKSAIAAGSRFVFTGTTTQATTTQAFTGLADGWYVARVKANYDDSSSSPWAWFTAGANVDSRTTDTTALYTDFSTATPGVNVETVSPWTKLGVSTGSLTIGGNGTGTLGYNTPDVMGGTVATQTDLYSGVLQDFPGSGKLFNEQVWSYRSTSGGNANSSVMLKSNSASAANGLLALFNDASFRVFKLTAGALATATGTTTYSVTLLAGLDYLVRLEASAGAQTIYVNNVAVATATEPTGGAWGNEAGFRLANTSFLNTNFTGTHIKSVRVGTTV